MADFKFEKSIDGYTAKYDKLLEKVLAQINREIYTIVNNVDGLPRRERMAYLIANRKRIIDLLQTQSTDAFNNSTSGAYKSAIIESDKLFAGIKSIPFVTTDITIFNLIRQNALNEMASYAGMDGQNLFSELVQYTLTGNKKMLEKGLLGNLELSKIVKYGDTIIDTNLMTFSRTVNGTRGLNAGVTTYMYDGPGPDKIIRPFCEEHLGKVYTIEEINAMDNGQTGDVFFTCGGWNCRHRWTPVQE